MSTVTSIGYCVMDKATADGLPPAVLLGRTGAVSYRTAGADRDTELMNFGGPNSEVVVGIDATRAERRALATSAADGKVYYNWGEFREAPVGRGWNPPLERPHHSNGRRYYFLTSRAWAAQVPAELEPRLGWWDEKEPPVRVRPTFAEAFTQGTLAGRVKPTNRKMIAMIDEPTLAEEAAMEAVATGARGYSNVEIKAEMVSEGGWEVAGP